MQYNNTIKLFKLKGKNVKIGNSVDSNENILFIHISKKVSMCSCLSCKSNTKRIHDHRYQKIKHTPINGWYS